MPQAQMPQAERKVSLSGSIAQAIPGLILVVALGVFAWWFDGYLKTNFNKFYKLTHFNYVLIAITAGMIIRNTVGIPSVFEPGLKYSTILTKIGIVVMGTKYTLASLFKVGTASMLFIAVFLFGTVYLMFWLRKYFTVSDPLVGCLASGMSVCGVSATVATGPAVNAKNEEMAYSIATVLIFGLAMLFTLPFIGELLGLTQNQFGAWAGIAIVNSAQVLAAGFAYGEQAGLMGGIFNLGRVVLLPFVVLTIVMIVLKHDMQAFSQQINKTQFIWQKFPIFIVAFLLAVILNTMGVFTKAELKLAKSFMTWAFCFGFASIGLTTKLSDMKAAGKEGIILGFLVAGIKAVLALFVVKWILPV